MSNLLLQKQKDTLKNYIQTELLKRGFHAKIIQFEEVEVRGSRYIEFSTEEFQTIPVIFKSISIGSFSTSVEKDKHTLNNGVEEEVVKVWITVHTRTMTFSNGSNGSELFQFNCIFQEDNEEMFKTNLR